MLYTNTQHGKTHKMNQLYSTIHYYFAQYLHVHRPNLSV